MIVLITHRPLEPTKPAAGCLARLAREPAYRALPLDPLDELELQELIRRLTAAVPDRRLVRRVHAVSGGNPLVAIAMTDDTIWDSPPPGRRRPTTSWRRASPGCRQPPPAWRWRSRSPAAAPTPT